MSSSRARDSRIPTPGRFRAASYSKSSPTEIQCSNAPVPKRSRRRCATPRRDRSPETTTFVSTTTRGDGATRYHTQYRKDQQARRLLAPLAPPTSLGLPYQWPDPWPWLKTNIRRRGGESIRLAAPLRYLWLARLESNQESLDPESSVLPITPRANQNHTYRVGAATCSPQIQTSTRATLGIGRAQRRPCSQHAVFREAQARAQDEAV